VSLALRQAMRQTADERIQVRHAEAAQVRHAVELGWSWNEVSRLIDVPVSTLIRRYGSP
jgi:hypothetical protein